MTETLEARVWCEACGLESRNPRTEPIVDGLCKPCRSRVPGDLICLRCGRALPSVIRRQSKEILCDGCDHAMNSGETVTKEAHWDN